MSFKKNRHPMEPLFKQHKILNFEKQKIFASVCFICRFENKVVPSNITVYFFIKKEDLL